MAKGPGLYSDIGKELKLFYLCTAIARVTGYSPSPPTRPLVLDDKFDKLSASSYHVVGPLTNTAVGAEVAHCFSRDEETITIGAQCPLNRMSTAMARVNNFGKASIMMRHELRPVFGRASVTMGHEWRPVFGRASVTMGHKWRPVSTVSFSAELDTRSIVESTKFGLALALN